MSFIHFCLNIKRNAFSCVLSSIVIYFRCCLFSCSGFHSVFLFCRAECMCVFMPFVQFILTVISIGAWIFDAIRRTNTMLVWGMYLCYWNELISPHGFYMITTVVFIFGFATMIHHFEMEIITTAFWLMWWLLLFSNKIVIMKYEMEYASVLAMLLKLMRFSFYIWSQGVLFELWRGVSNSIGENETFNPLKRMLWAVFASNGPWLWLQLGAAYRITHPLGIIGV